MPRGYAGKFLDVDLSNDRIKDITFSDGVLRNYVGGRGLATRILWDRLGKKWQKVDPLGPENLFMAMLGPMTAIYPGARVCITGKSPQCNGIIGSTCSGEFPSELKCAGYDGVIVSGKAEKPVYILVTDDKAEIRDAKNVWGTESPDTIRIMNKEVREELSKRFPKVGVWKEPGMIYCGPAGENRVRTACVLQKISHAAGYGGYGAVMGSKNLKAIVAKGRKPLPDVASPAGVVLLWREVDRRFCNREREWPTVHGTGYDGYNTGASSSSEPIRNWQEEWHDEKGYGGPKFDYRYWVKRYWSDFNCAGSCMKLAVIKTGPYKGAFTDDPDYELEAYCGPNLGIFDPGKCIYMASLIDYLGFSGINGPNTMGFTAELYQRGILTKKDIGFELKWGDVEAFEKLARKIVKREGIGDVLAEGTYRAALKISKMKGVDVTKYAVHVKGVEIGAHGTRSGQDYRPIGYACSPQCGDHTSGVFDAYQDMGSVFSDSAVFCNFVQDWELTWDYFRAITGWDTTQEEWNRVLGPRIMQIQRAVLLLGGPDIIWDPAVHDDNPPRFYEPLPSGPYKGKTTDKKEVAKQKKQFYKAIGWDKNGIPKSEVLKKLGLNDVDKEMEKLRK
jgi:aldehyde:ferredoxin oxidoreductase